ncbi:hypothetical protein [Paeniglutamicibacter gangotriensis]|uniref:Uncharacterized protein n=1 Tax=Paeniglutamicibacter gangotriensis Lz1y TaxID=1276920 RepID=M7N4H1_9MICC|nr:hypothetical protein [Paeniglutamicibacter gangotriensis]EMQ96654.1 hypothetical protein ADIAG_03980 [Paeniglutamicibacter gangotriensis Lz1y]
MDINDVRKRQTELVQILASESSTVTLAQASNELEELARWMEEHKETGTKGT